MTDKWREIFKLQARICDLEAQVRGGDAANSRLQKRIIELERENAALKKTIEIDNCGRAIIEAKDKAIARKDAALKSAEKELTKAITLSDTDEIIVRINGVRNLIRAALKEE